MEFTQEQRDKLFHFLGYGNLNAPFWFLGMEEGTGGQAGAEKIEWNIKRRLEFFDEVMDLRESHDSNRLHWEYWDPTKRERLPSVWIYMARIVRALGDERASDWWDKEKAKTYVREHLGRKHANGKTFLTEMLPLPKPSAGSWPVDYSSLYKTRREYEQTILPRRAEKLRNFIDTYKPKYLFCYGKKNFEAYKKMANLPETGWRSLPGNIEVGVAESTCVVLTPFLGNGAINKQSVYSLIDDLKQAAT